MPASSILLNNCCPYSITWFCLGMNDITGLPFHLPIRILYLHKVLIRFGASEIFPGSSSSSSKMSAEGLEYWLQWQVGLCAVIVAGPSFLAMKYVKNSKQEPLNSVDSWKTCWKSVDPLWLLCYRAFAFLCLAKILYDFLVIFPLFTFFFYTQWTFILVTLYFGLATIISAHGCFVARTELKGKPKSKTQQKAGFFGNLMQIIYMTSAGASMLTDTVFWCLILPFLTSMEFEMTLLIGAMHVVNAGFLIVDTALNRLPFPSLGFAYFVLFGSLYITFQWTIHAFGVNWWPYPFLELNTPWAPVCYFGLALVHIPCYWIYNLIVKAKGSMLPKMFPRSFIRLHS